MNGDYLERGSQEVRAYQVAHGEEKWRGEEKWKTKPKILMAETEEQNEQISKRVMEENTVADYCSMLSAHLFRASTRD